jgi:ATP/maltotriose-dependent transcriptional regulator MalT
MIPSSSPHQLHGELHRCLDEIDEKIARESTSKIKRALLRDTRGIFEDIELLWRSELRSDQISVAHKNRISTLFKNINKHLLDEFNINFSRYERLFKQMVAIRQMQPLINTVRITKREEEILQLLTRGNSAEEISQILHISVPTVKTHLASLYRKLGVKNRTSAINKARTLRIVT